MSIGRRLLATGVVLALVGLLSYSHVLGEAAKNPDREKWRAEGERPAAEPGGPVAEEIAACKFADKPVVTYRTLAGETLFALQVQPALDRPAARPRDFLVIIDTSASQAGEPLQNAIKLTKALVAGLGVGDRVAIRTANTDTRDLTGGFKAAADVSAALKALEQEYGSGATNLKKALTAALKDFEGRAGRQQAILFFGDGQSILDPITTEARSQLCEQLVKAEVAFFPLPLGPRPNPDNLHGLAIGTGGAPIRLFANDRGEETLKRLHETVNAPILYPKDFKLLGEIAEAVPGKMPPLRGDVPTLVIGKVKGGTTVGYHLSGLVAGQEQVKEKTETLPEPEADNFFLASLLNQWRGDRDSPARLRADRALAYAQETNELARADLIAQAEWALGDDKWEVAEKLFEQALQLDPNDGESKAGLEVVKKLRSGALTKDQLREQAKPKADDTVVRINKVGERVTKERILAVAAQREQDAGGAGQPGGGGPIAPPAGGNDILKEARQRQAAEDQRMTQIIADTIRGAERFLRSDPDTAHDQLKRALDGVRNNPDLSERARQELTRRLESSLRSVDTQGIRIKQDLAEQAERIARWREAVTTLATQEAIDTRIAERMRIFHNYMNLAREDLAQAQALAIRTDLINAGVPVPPAVDAGYIVGQAGNNLREVRELKRLREDRYLLAMLSVERSHIPFPDEPPIQFPPAATWKAITKLRKDRYESSGLGEETPRRTFELREALSKPVKFKGFEADPKMTLEEALNHLADRYDLTFDVNEAAFKSEMVDDVLQKPIAEKAIPPMFNVSLDTILRRILARVPSQSGTTYIIRRDVIEITTLARARAEKVVRVYPVADLVIPIPNAVNAQALQQAGSIFGFFGAQGVQGGLLNVGFQGGFAGFQGGFPGFQGGFNGFGGVAGFQGQFQGGGPNGIQGFQGLQGGQQNLGVGGNIGFGGGQLGQFGNLGGQFGFQGGTQQKILVDLIRQVVGTPRDWAPLRGVNLLGNNNPGGALPDDTVGDPEGNDLGYYPPALALVVKASSRIHTRVGGGDVPTGPPLQMGAGEGFGREGIVRVGGAKDKDLEKKPDTKVAGDKEQNKDPNKAVAQQERKKPPKWDADPRTVWEEALAKGVDDPGLIVACADYLVQAGRFDHAAEFLKANLRQGIVVRPWVYEALAVALTESKGSPEEIERAEVSEADLEPLDAQGFLKAAQAMGQHKRYETAVAFCRQAALLEPSIPYPYQDALVYATQAKDVEGLEWAGTNLLGHDWPADNQKLQASARDKLSGMAKELEKDNQPGASRLQSALAKQRERDLVIRLSWGGEADLDLKVEEPTGSVCSWLNRQTVGGGTLIGDTLSEPNTESYVNGQAFPGVYKVTVDTVWGRPLGGKARLEVIQHQGTPQETTLPLTVNLESNRTVTVKLDAGRRTELASVPPPSLARQPDPPAEMGGGVDRVLSQLRALTDPGDAVTGLRGSVTGAGTPADRPVKVDDKQREQLTYQTKVSPFVTNSFDLTAQATISADRRYVRLSLAPSFVGVTRTQNQGFVTPFFPGGFRP
jgi:tetratricopeptide (TPR) repeat protein